MIKDYEDAWALGMQYNNAVYVYNSEPNEDNWLAMAELTAPIILVENWSVIQKAREEGVDLEE